MHVQLAIVNAHVVPIDNEPFDGSILISDGRITALGPDTTPGADATVVDADGQWVLPGFIDAHTHLGVHEEGEGWAGSDSNETTDPVTAGVRALDAINPVELGFDDALSGGVTTVNVNPGSANPIGGLTVAIHTSRPHRRRNGAAVTLGAQIRTGRKPQACVRRSQAEPIDEARHGCGHPRRLRRSAELSRETAHAEPDKAPPARDLKLEAIGSVLRGDIPWRQHSHRADDIATAIRIADEFGYQLVIDHGTEAHLIADLLAAKGIPVLIGPLLTSRSKVELRNRSMANPGRLAAAGVEISIITDHPVVPINFLVHQATFAVKEGLDPVVALRAITINPAKAMGVDDRVGSLAVGKDADLVLWSGDPLDVMQRALSVYIGGREVYSYDTVTRQGTVAPR